MTSPAGHRPEGLSRVSARGTEWLDTEPACFCSDAFAENSCDGALASSTFAATAGSVLLPDAERVAGTDVVAPVPIAGHTFASRLIRREDGARVQPDSGEIVKYEPN